MLICIEGIDGSGKETQAKLLASRLIREGEGIMQMSFPNYDSASGRLIKHILHGRIEYPMVALQPLYAVNRYERQNLIREQLDFGTIVICDRYIPSSQAYGLAQGQDLHYLDALDKMNVQPDLVIWIDIDPVVAVERMENKDRDMNEHERFLEKVATGYEILSLNKNWYTIDGEQPELRVAKDVYAAVRDWMVK